MTLRALFTGLLIALFAAFAIVNWSALSAATTLSLVFTTVQAPLGLILLGFTVLIVAAFLFLLVFQQARAILDTRRYAKELSSQRTLADQAEASRFTELRGFLESELKSVEARSASRQDALIARLDQVERALQAHVDQVGNSLSACIGEVDDRLERLGGSAAEPSSGPARRA